VHAAALKAVALKDPQKASVSAELLGDMGRQALTELRQMLGVLRTAAEPAPAAARAVSSVAAASSGSASGSAPVPGPGSVAASSAALALESAWESAEVDEEDGPCLAKLAELVEESQAAGMGVELSIEGEERACGPRVESTVYRVVQEALTNVHKHAAGARARVLLAYREAEIAVLITNGPSDGSAATSLPSGGHGLLGMRERVASHGGGFAAGPTPEGGFRVSAMIPVPV
jgi:signal transduction histidine kinase